MIATENKASLGQGYNQSMVQQEMRAGNFLNLVLSRSPTGDMANTMCSWLLTFSRKRP